MPLNVSIEAWRGDNMAGMGSLKRGIASRPVLMENFLTKEIEIDLRVGHPVKSLCWRRFFQLCRKSNCRA